MSDDEANIDHRVARRLRIAMASGAAIGTIVMVPGYVALLLHGYPLPKTSEEEFKAIGGGVILGILYGILIGGAVGLILALLYTLIDKIASFLWRAVGLKLFRPKAGRTKKKKGGIDPEL